MHFLLSKIREYPWLTFPRPRGHGRVSGAVIARNMYGSASETIIATTMSAPPTTCCGVIDSFSHTTLRMAASTGSMLNSTADSVGPSCVWAVACPQNAKTVEPSARYSVAPATEIGRAHV